MKRSPFSSGTICILLEGLRKTTKSQSEWPMFRRDSNRAASEYKSTALPLHHPARCNGTKTEISLRETRKEIKLTIRMIGQY
jgi:hypothetical protein